MRLAEMPPTARAHICAFFNHPDEQYEVLRPFIMEGLQAGEKAVHTVDPSQRDTHRQKLSASGIELDEANRNGQFELRDWSNTHLRGGCFDPQATLALFRQVVQGARQGGFSRTRFVTHMEWALEAELEPEELLEYEARANDIWMLQDGPVDPVICTYDLTRFRGDLVVDIMRTHPLVIIGGILQENPFFVPPDQFLEQLRKRRATEI